MDSDLGASILIHNRNDVWINDNMVTACYNCKTEFGFFLRKHHCRNCGNIFCHACSNQSIIIPDFITDRPNAADYWNISYYVRSLKGVEEKVCKQCYDLIKEKTNAHERIVKILNNPVPLDKIKELSESSSDIKNHYFDHLRNIQYHLPNYSYSDIDKKLLRANAPFFSKHSKYLVHLIKSIDWNILSPSRSAIKDSNDDLCKYIIALINGDRIKNCSELFCTRTCQEAFSCDDCINILYSCVNHLPEELLSLFFSIIAKTPEEIILCHLSFFITLIKNNSTNKTLQTLVFNLLNQSAKMVYHTYWFLNNAKETANIQEMNNINIFIELFDKALIRKMHQEYMFFVGLIGNLNDPKKYLISVFDSYKPITLPYDPNIQLIGVDLDGIITKSSYTKPIIIPFQTNIGPIKLLFKKECVMNDVTVLNLMTLCDIILSETIDINFGIVVYPVMPLTANSGMIEIINNAETVYDITKSKKTILQYIVEKNEDKLIGDVLDRYMYSLVSYTLHSYFMGILDRHACNLMITEDGAIFHIDFGFILGKDAFPLTGSEIKLNSGMLDVIGGAGSARYSRYLELCSKGITILRKYYSMFFILLNQETKFEEKFIEKFVLTRFQPRQNDHEIISELMAIIKQSNDAYGDYIRDFLHHHNQQKTVQTGVAHIFKKAFGAVKSFSDNSH